MDAAMVERILAESPSEPFVRTLRRLAEAEPDAPALTCGEESVTRGELERRSNRLARTFAEKGVGLGDFVAIALPNGIDFFVAFLATLKVGGVPMPLSYRLPLAERKAIVDLAGPKLLVGVAESDHPGFAGLPTGYRPDETISDEPLPEVVSPAWKAPTSGGSTGRPKIIVAGSPAEGSPALNALLFRSRPDDVQVVVGPLYHNGPLVFSIGGLLLGQHLVIMKRFDAEELLGLIERYRVSWLMLVPTMLHRMHRVLQAGKRYDLSSIRVIWHMASKCPEWLKQAWIDRLGPEKIMELYGGTEMQAVAVISGQEWLRHRGSVGRPVIGQMKILDANGDEVPAGTVGEIFMKRPEGTPATYRYIGAEPRGTGDWETLGDLGWKDEDGYVYISDRRIDMIVSGGANIYPAEVESALDAHPKVLSTVVVGIPDDDLGQRVHALVQAEEGTTAQELLDFLADKIVRYKIPRSIEFIDTPLRDDAGKVRRSLMRDEAIARLTSNATLKSTA
ncbi:bile acid-coenzyme A ligase [Thermocatellispora tengchongensis]|uniref:Bile acid-coenzyme A ligase n=1 Tax=Thermocatellispora tengchongensis TaxID=1073253 RepID=A0A840PBJ8_9ACTN|nr:AMP-binding protein [Thermocatellispora tengchongensis]MBB5136056.1 bile acid-coenzyme A ligase [Thermocatellispora tengchongensis]